MTIDRMEVRSSVPVRKFVRVYKDFLESETLTAEEKLVFIALKSFVEFGRDEDEVYPSMATMIFFITSYLRTIISSSN